MDGGKRAYGSSGLRLLLDGPILRYAVSYLVALTLARMPYDAERSAGLHTDSNSRAWRSGRSANAVPRIPATAQRGRRGLATGDESTAIGALRSIISCLLSRGGDTQVRRRQSRVMRHFCPIVEPRGQVPPRGGTGSRQCLCWTPASTISSRYHPALRS